MQIALRRGLPRTPGAQPWPPETLVDVDDASLPAAAALAAPAGAAPAGAAPAATAPAGAAAAESLVEVPLRQGLPRIPGGEPWPPAAAASVDAEALPRLDAPAAAGAAATPAAEPAPTHFPEPAKSEPAKSEPAKSAPAKPAAAKAAKPGPAKPAAKQKPVPRRGARWVGPVIGGVLVLLAVFAAKWILSTPGGSDFIQRYDGTQPLPENAPVGIPAWLGWAHFFNMFLMVLIVRTGWMVRREAKAPAYFAPRSNPKAKLSLTLWTHLVLDAAWILLGAIFYILLFTTGQWMRIVPTSWDVFPNAVSAGLQYLSLDWPLEDPWVHYNALQELSYFAVVFIAAPLAIISGARMSPWWPKRWTGFPMKAARAIHFPTMVFFLLFIVVHVALVLFTGLRQNMNAMYAASQDAQSWTGTLVFLGSLLVIAAGWFATKPFVTAPLAGRFGTVSQR